jgi:hypothetical protein
VDKVKITYVINGATKQDVLVASDMSIQREGSAVHIQFPNEDGTYLIRFSRAVIKGYGSVSWVTYAQADRVERSKVKTDTPTEPS